MEIAQAIQTEWHEQHGLCRESLHWLAEHADTGDKHPVTTGIDLLRESERAWIE
jgi:hypothetical protein